MFKIPGQFHSERRTPDCRNDRSGIKADNGYGCGNPLIPFDEEHIRIAIEDICTMHGDDALSFHFTGIAMIRDDDEYDGFRVLRNAVFEVIGRKSGGACQESV
jgi:hypothetical protein